MVCILSLKKEKGIREKVRVIWYHLIKMFFFFKNTHDREDTRSFELTKTNKTKDVNVNKSWQTLTIQKNNNEFGNINNFS